MLFKGSSKRSSKDVRVETAPIIPLKKKRAESVAEQSLPDLELSPGITEMQRRLSMHFGLNSEDRGASQTANKSRR